jgi:hypothetical protein
MIFTGQWDKIARGRRQRVPTPSARRRHNATSNGATVSLILPELSAALWPCSQHKAIGPH